MIEPAPREDEIPPPEPPQSWSPATTREELLRRLIDEMDAATCAGDDKYYVCRSLERRLATPETAPS
jgi:hypothetical protein